MAPQCLVSAVLVVEVIEHRIKSELVRHEEETFVNPSCILKVQNVKKMIHI